jgi:subtilisin family serine protease
MLRATTTEATAFYRVAENNRIHGQYILHLKKPHSESELLTHISSMRSQLGSEFNLHEAYGALAGHGFPAFSAKLSERALEHLLQSNHYLFIEEDQEVNISVTVDVDVDAQPACVSQSNPDWGLRRCSTRGPYTPGSYKYTPGHDGAGILAYVIDTGIYCGNNDFVTKQTGTCINGVDYVDGSHIDGHGHGTHVAGTVGGQKYGVAKEVDLIAVRVLDNNGSGSWANVISGINWSLADSINRQKPGVANMSLGGGFSQSVNSAVEAAVAGGLHIVVAAGNSNDNACNYSPASAPSAITVGATDISDYRASYSNYGSCLDIFGPGTNIKSAWIGSPDATNTISGTSMASPHVAGAIAQYLSKKKTLTPTQIARGIPRVATPNVVINPNGSPNYMVYGGCM